MTPRWHSLATSAAWGGARSVLRSTAMPSRPLEVEASVEGMAARIVEAERAGAEDPHQDRAGCRGALEDEAHHDRPHEEPEGGSVPSSTLRPRWSMTAATARARSRSGRRAGIERAAHLEGVRGALDYRGFQR